MTWRGRRLTRRKMDTVLTTWNVRNLKRPGKLKEIREETDKYGITCIQLDGDYFEKDHIQPSWTLPNVFGE
jgi:hypothetical protein